MNLKVIFYILSIIVIGAGAWFGWSNKGKIEAEIALFDTTRQDKVRVQGIITDTNSTLDDTNKALDESKNKNSELKAKKQSEESKFGQLRKELEEYVAEIEGHDARLKRLAEIEAQIQEALKGIDVPWDQVPEEIRKLKDERKRRGDDLEQLNKLVAKLEGELSDKQAQLQRLDERLGEIRTKIARNSKTGVVTVVNMDFGFVVVNLGEKNSNITPESELLVTRGGRLVAVLKPSSVEPVQTVCDLNLKDLTAGVLLQPGDKVTLSDSSGS